ncbi:MAG: nitrate reductase cytochrome c-type subunit [Pseudomonadota bacterium]
MKTSTWIAALLACAVGGASAADKGVSEAQMGLSRTGVNADGVPDAFEYRQADPYSGGVLPRAFVGAPPQVPHSVDGLVPITRDSNACISCHQQPDQVGKRKVKGQPTPLPKSHYTDVRNNALHMGRYNCTQCHAPQADVKSLVGNTFKGK